MTKTIDFVGDSGECYIADKQIAEGGQGMVYHAVSKSDSRSYAVKFYRPNRASNFQRQQLESLVKQGKPSNDLESIEFIWPIELVRFGNSSSYGYVMPLYDADCYVHYNKVINGKIKQPRRNILARMSYLVCMALESVHKKGMAYCDINLGNIHFDVEQGRLIVCDNDNVVVNNSGVSVDGVAEFMAPEVTLGQCSPNAQTDLYSIAVLLYQLWLWEHPMEGAQTAQVRCWDQPAKLKRYAKEPVFAHHPSDFSNSAAADPMLGYSVKRWNKICTDSLRELFTRTFTEGVHNHNQRPRLNEWEKCFMEIEANSIHCPKCSAVNVMEPVQPQQTCYNCGLPLSARLKLIINNRGYNSCLMVFPDAILRRHHTENFFTGKQALDVLGRVENHPKQPGAHIFRNLTNDVWLYQIGEEQLRIEPGKARPIGPGGKIMIDNVTVNIELV